MNNNDNDLKPDADELVESCPESRFFKQLEEVVNHNRRGAIAPDAFYELSVRAAFSKCYDFNIAVRESLDDLRVAFCLPSLRGICEELIVLGYLSKIPGTARNDLTSKLMTHSIAIRTQIQSRFFDTVRPQQPVLPSLMTQDKIKELEGEIQALWHSNGWPNLNRGVIPPTREIAQKQGSQILLYLYDYLYRLTSGTVHFDVPSLLKTGWGDSLPNVEFSVRHFNLYYAGFARTYGAFLFVSYLELFSDLLNPLENELELIDEIRKWLRLASRWPEMVTFEEMNLTPPKPHIFSVAVGLVQHEKEPRLLG